MTLGATMQQSSPPAYDSAPPAIGARSGQQGPSGNTELGWNRDPSTSVAKRPSWLFWAVPVLALSALVTLGFAIWLVVAQDEMGEVVSAADSAASGSVPRSKRQDASPEATVEVKPPTGGSASSTESSARPPRTAAPSAATVRATTTRTVRSPPVHTGETPTTKTATPAKTGTGSIEDFLPSDRK